MAGRRHSRAVQLAAVVLARQAGVDAAAASFGIDPRTVRSWLKAGDVPEDEWTAIRDVLRARGAEMAAKGDTRGLVAVLTAAGISDRNVRYGELIARREARREAELEPTPVAPNPIHEAIAALRDDQVRLFRVMIDLRLEGERDGTEPEPSEATTPADEERQAAALLAYIADLASLTPEQVAEQVTELEAEYWGRPQEAPPLSAPVLDAPTVKEAWMVNVTPEPATPPVPRPPVTVLEVGEHLEDHPSWRRLE